MSDRIAIMRDGRIEQLADADTIYSSPASAYVAGFVGQQNFLTGVAGDEGQVETEVGTVRSTRTVPVRPGQRVRVAVRPEVIALEPSPPTESGPNSVRGRVLGVAHQGETRQFLLDAGTERTLLVRRPTPVAPDLRVGDDAWAHWAAGDVHLFDHNDQPDSGDGTTHDSDATAERTDR